MAFPSLRSLWLGAAVVALLAGCVAQGGSGPGPARADLARELIRRPPGSEAPEGPAGACWAKDTTPAVIETVTEQVVVTQEQRDAAGKVIVPASFRTITSQRMLREREEVWFRTPCPADQTVAFVATLQRALKARGLYDQPVTGVMDGATAAAIRRFQAERGLDSATLSLAAARELGLSAVELDRL